MDLYLVSLKKLLEAALMPAKKITIQKRAAHTSGRMAPLKLRKPIKTTLKTYSKIPARAVFWRNSSLNSLRKSSMMCELFKPGTKIGKKGLFTA